MKHPFNRERFWIVIGIVAVTELLVFFLVFQRKQFFATNDVSELYTKYSNTPGIDASFIKNYRVNDTVFVDVTLLEAVDSNGWNILKHDFCLPDLQEVPPQKINVEKELLFTRIVKKENHCEPADESTSECDILAISFTKHTLCVFSISDLNERYAVIHYNFDKSTNY